jgi:hypothetical protein
VRHEGVNHTVWSDHTDIRPTMLMLLGLHDDYLHDGRAITEPLYAWALPQALRAHRETLLRLGAVYKQINAAVGQLGLDSLQISTQALESGSPAGDSTYTTLENQLATITARRNALAAQMQALLESATFDNQAADEQQARALIAQGQALLDDVAAQANGH